MRSDVGGIGVADIVGDGNRAWNVARASAADSRNYGVVGGDVVPGDNAVRDDAVRGADALLWASSHSNNNDACAHDYATADDYVGPIRRWAR